MKKLTLTFAFVSVAFVVLSQTSPVLTQFGIYENFSTATDAIVNTTTGRGLYWWPSAGTHQITRDTSKNQLLVKMTQKAYGYVPFGLSFGDSNGAAAGGSPFTVDLSVNGKFSFDIINKDTIQSISMRVACHDTLNRQVDCDAGATTFNDIWKYQTQIIIPAGDTVTFEAGTPNGAGGGIINACNFATGVWGDYGTNPHIIRTDCDLKHIKQITFTVLNAKKKASDGHAEALDTCLFAIANVIIGDTSSQAQTAMVPVLTLSTTTASIADTSKSTVTIDFTSTGKWTAKSNMSWLSVKIDTLTGIITLTALNANTTMADRTAFVTLSAKYAKPQTITLTQAVAKNAGINSTSPINRYYHVHGNTIYFDKQDIRVYDIAGHLLTTEHQSSITLSTGTYIIYSPEGSEKIVLNK